MKQCTYCIYHESVRDRWGEIKTTCSHPEIDRVGVGVPLVWQRTWLGKCRKEGRLFNFGKGDRAMTRADVEAIKRAGLDSYDLHHGVMTGGRDE